MTVGWASVCWGERESATKLIPLSQNTNKKTPAVPLPERVTPPSEETDHLQPDPQPPQKERWTDLGLGALH